MAVGLFVVRATITAEREAAFNKWYNEEHLPQVLRYKGAISGRRYRKVVGEDRYQYMALYEFASEAVLHQFLESGALKDLRAEYDKHFGAVSERVGQGWVQVFPSRSISLPIDCLISDSNTRPRPEMRRWTRRPSSARKRCRPGRTRAGRRSEPPC